MYHSLDGSTGSFSFSFTPPGTQKDMSGHKREGRGDPQTPAVAGFPWQLEVEDLDAEEAAGGHLQSGQVLVRRRLSSGERPQ